MGRFIHHIALVGLAGAAAVLTACSSSVTGKGTTVPSSPASSPIASSSAPASGFPSSPAASSGGTAGGSCASDADYCDDFTSQSTGWPVENKAHYFAGYDPYLGGTYRVGERTDATVSETAPFDVTKISSDYSVQVDVDAVLGTAMPSGTGMGISCWEHEAKDGQSTSAFVFLVTDAETSIGLWSEADGAYHDIVTNKTPGLLKTAGAPNHVTATCIQGTSGGSAEAHLGIAINGTDAATATYAKSVKNYEWGVGSHVGVLASGKDSDVFYDNFTLTSKCEGTYC